MKLALPWLYLCVVVNAAADRPAFSDVLNAADYSGGRVSPGEIVVLFPSGAGPEALSGAQLGADGKVITSLAETRVLFDGIAAPMAYSVRGRVAAVVPYEVAGKGTTQVVVEYQGMRSVPVTLPVVESAPALFTLDSSGKGQAAMLNEVGCCNSARNPAARGTIAVLYATGEGQISPPVPSGTVSVYSRAADIPAPKLPLQVTVGGKRAEILYAGEAPHAVSGLLQVNFRVPADAPIGDAVPIVLAVGNVRSRAGVTMAVRPAVHQILVIEREPAVRDRLARMLAAAGYEAFTAADDREAAAQAGQHAIDLVITDLGPGAAGRLETLGRMRERRSQLKVIVTAAGTDPETLKAADLLGAQAVLTRPIVSESAIERVKAILLLRPVPYETPMYPLP